MLDIKDLVVHYGGICALNQVSLHVDEREIISVIGANGAGKSTLMKSIVAVKSFTSGTITFQGHTLKKEPNDVIKDGITLAPEGRRIFPSLSVRENLMAGAYTRDDRHEIEDTMKEVFELFPRLKERINQLGGTLSGGEQQMLATGRGLMNRPALLAANPMILRLMKYARLNRRFAG